MNKKIKRFNKNVELYIFGFTLIVVIFLAIPIYEDMKERYRVPFERIVIER